MSMKLNKDIALEEMHELEKHHCCLAGNLYAAWEAAVLPLNYARKLSE
jgi:hypothetical protein